MLEEVRLSWSDIAMIKKSSMQLPTSHHCNMDVPLKCEAGWREQWAFVDFEFTENFPIPVALLPITASPLHFAGECCSNQ